MNFPYFVSRQRGEGGLLVQTHLNAQTSILCKVFNEYRVVLSIDQNLTVHLTRLPLRITETLGR